MKQIIIRTARLISILALTTTPLAAAILTVDNKPGSVAMFNNLQDAYNAAQQDDTIVLAASPTNYGSLSVYKRLHFRGPGYLLSQNGIPGTNLTGNEATVSMAFYNSPTSGNSSGSSVSGLDVFAQMAFSFSSVTSIVFDKCDLELDLGSSTAGNVTVTRSYCSLVHNQNASNTINVNIKNTIITNQNIVNPRFGGSFGTITIDHCVIFTTVMSPNVSSAITNTVFLNSNNQSPADFLDNYKGNISHCMAVGSSYLPTGNNNINGANLQDVFLGSGSLDARWQLKPTSPARGAGLDGVDLGASGGTLPYVLSGLPSKPRLTRFIAPAVATEASGLQLELEAQSF